MLAARVQHGDAAAFDTLVGRHVERAFRVAFRLLGQREDAEDLVQDAFLRVLERIDDFDPRRGFGPWFYRILVNRGLNARKARALRHAEALPAAVPSRGSSPEWSAERLELQERLHAAMAALPERQQLIVRLFELEGFSGREIAEILELKEGTVRWHLHQARGALREALAVYHEK